MDFERNGKFFTGFVQSCVVTVTEIKSSLSPMKIIVFFSSLFLCGLIFFFTRSNFRSGMEKIGTCSSFYSKNLNRVAGKFKGSDRFEIIYTFRLGFDDAPFDHILTDLSKKSRLRYIRHTPEGTFEEDLSFPMILTEHAREVTPFKFGGRDAFIVADHGPDLPPFPGGHLKLLVKENGVWKNRSSLLPSQLGFYFNVTVIDEHPDDTRILVNGIPESFVIHSHRQGPFRIDRENSAIFKQPHSCFMTSEKISVSGRTLVFLGGCDRSPEVEKTPHDRIAEYKEGRLTLLPENTMALRETDATWGSVDAIFADLNNDDLPDIISSVHNFGFSQAGIQIHMNTSKPDAISFSSSYIPATDLRSKAFIPFVKAGKFHHSEYSDIVASVNEFLPKGEEKRRESTFVLLENQDGKSFKRVEHCLYSNLPSVMTAEFIDLDKNGKQDLFLISYDGRYEIFFNQ